MKNKLVIYAIAVLVIVGGVFFYNRKKSPVSVLDVAVISGEAQEVDSLQADLNTLQGDDEVLTEIDDTLGDVAEIPNTSSSSALDKEAIAKEQNQADFSNDVTKNNADEASLRDLDGAFSDVSQ